MKRWHRIAICIVLIELVGIWIGYLTSGQIAGWFATLEKPPGNPPSWVFGPVWTTLYAMMGVSLGILWQRAADGSPPVGALACFATQLVLNFAWTPLFFGAHRMDLALVVIAALIVVLVPTIALAGRISKLAGWMLVPYFFWVCYATYLNTAFWHLNK